ncbi:MAG: hypothetical protein WAW17_02885 [Rhodococcus sp. (in: high G+C Gram-positive bacteria)]|uniref:Rv1733c family protein n=1 Tax=Rhodococcus sp. TaxID=1831 RepID=UPI003BAFFCEF
MIGDQTIPVRMWRLAPWNRNRLMRAGDRWESAGILLVSLLVLIMIPFAAAFGTTTYTDLNEQARVDRETRREVPAVLLEDAQPAPGDNAARSPDGKDRAAARWTVDGTEHSGDVQAESGMKAGATVIVWVDPNGDLADAPRTGVENAVLAVGAAVSAWASASALCLGLLLLARWLAGRHRLAQWDREWEQIGKKPGWPVS